MIGVRHADFAYGNTRLRARKSELLDNAAYERLVGKDIDGVLGGLADTPYAPSGGLHGLHRAIRLRLAVSLEEMRSFYSGPARELIDALLSRFDVQNVIAVVRARAHRQTPDDDALAALVPVGWLVEPLVTEILRPRELAGVVDLLARRAPDHELAGVLRTAFAEYERTGDLAALERQILAFHAERLAGRLASAGKDGATLLRFGQREIDERNLMVALRLRDAIASGAQGTVRPAETVLAGGTLPPPVLAMIVSAAAPASIVATVGRLAGGKWRAALDRWTATGDLNALQRGLERAAIADAIALFGTGDPLGIDIPLAFTTAVQVEARNLRLIGEAAVRGIAPEVVRAELIWPEGPK
ncbi:V-type ATPase subunit [Paractinoplanes rhizophilus]|jgi:vacuolar-type H+-ATPase subunit C/Vma6|uniref:V-type ATPase subunit n=1 Tax=Paractinoplanes rhizophilus TaxID=1416877 RepID=A0ABW2I2J7_9ACTN|nr:V-type ATPase subunit [Actinoplanes sp.]